MEEPLLALVSVTMDHEFAIHDIKIVQGKERRFLAMPSRRMSDGSYRDIVHPIGSAMREKLERTVLEEYERVEPAAGRLSPPRGYISGANSRSALPATRGKQAEIPAVLQRDQAALFQRPAKIVFHLGHRRAAVEVDARIQNANTGCGNPG